jgi:hypothetical protein
MEKPSKNPVCPVYPVQKEVCGANKQIILSNRKTP